MQKAIIIQSRSDHNLPNLNPAPLNAELAAGWRFVAAVPFGLAAGFGGRESGSEAAAAILVIVEKP